MMRHLFLAIMILGSAVVTSADERILKYHSDIVVNEDGSMDVTEEITVRSEATRIRRGIYRDFPTDYKDRLGNRVRIGFDVQFVRRDGRNENYRVERQANGVRIYAGRESVFLDPGVYTYEIGYRTTHMLGFFDDHDELYWNVTGNGWDFPIDEASATVRLPDAVNKSDVRVQAYTGPYGSSGRDYASEVDPDAVASVRATRLLNAREGLSVVVSWPKGVIDEPTAAQRFKFLLSQNRGLLVALAGTAGALGILFVSWLRVGRDPPPGVVMPLYEPPSDMSPASLRYIAKMRYDKGALSTATLNLAVKGFVTIAARGGDYSLQRTKKAADNSLAPGEAVLLIKLFARGNNLSLKNDNHAVIGAARKAHLQTLRRYHHKRFFLDNASYLVPAIALVIGTLIVTRLMDEQTTATGIVFAIGFLGIALFWWLLKTPTPLGRKLLDKVDGFRMYLEFAEKDELHLKNPPEETPELFERYLPYALALDVEQPWAERFADVLKKAAREDGTAYRPNWYSGRFDSSNPTRFASTIGHSLGSAISSAATPPGSSSGGGGFSGGGGGGGGGGGW